MMAAIRTQWNDAQWFNWGYTVARVSGTSFTVVTASANTVTLPAAFVTGARIKLYDTSTMYGTITTVSATAASTTVTFTPDSGSLTNSFSSVYNSIITPDGYALPAGVEDGRLVSFQFLSAGSGTYTKPAGINHILVEIIGGGGGGGGAPGDVTKIGGGAGGGGGGYCRKWISPSAASYSYTVGTGGAGGNNAAGDAGVTSSFDVYSATGGGGGAVAVLSAASELTAPAIEVSGVGSGGDLNVDGGNAMPGFASTLFGGLGGSGGDSYFGGGANGQIKSTAGVANGNPGLAYGGGGSGSAQNASASTSTGGAGGNGIIVVWEFS